MKKLDLYGNNVLATQKLVLEEPGQVSVDLEGNSVLSRKEKYNLIPETGLQSTQYKVYSWFGMQDSNC